MCAPAPREHTERAQGAARTHFVPPLHVHGCHVGQQRRRFDAVDNACRLERHRATLAVVPYEENAALSSPDVAATLIVGTLDPAGATALKAERAVGQEGITLRQNSPFLLRPVGLRLWLGHLSQVLPGGQGRGAANLRPAAPADDCSSQAEAALRKQGRRQGPVPVRFQPGTAMYLARSSTLTTSELCT
eukprot:COSAG01_NODE_1176_length_11374_cov_476.847805_10_plen_189_part_00